MHSECMEMRDLMDMQAVGCISEGQRNYLNHHALFCPECAVQMVLYQPFPL